MNYFSWTDNSKCNLAEKTSSIDVLIKYLTHELAEIRTAVYCSIAMIVAVMRRLLFLKIQMEYFRVVYQ